MPLQTTKMPSLETKFPMLSQVPTLIRAFTSSSDQTSIWRVSRNFVKVDNVITCELLVSMPAQFVKMLAAAMASKIFFWELMTIPSSSARLLRVSKPRKITNF